MVEGTIGDLARWVQVVAIDPSAAFRKAITDALPDAAVSVDHFHLVQLANQMLTMVRQRVSRDLKGRRGRAIDASWANRRLLLRGHDTLSEKARARLVKTLRQDDPTQEIGAAWGIKEQLLTLLAGGGPCPIVTRTTEQPNRSVSTGHDGRQHRL